MDVMEIEVPVLGVDLPVVVEYGEQGDAVYIDEIRVMHFGQVINRLLCEDAQKEVEAHVVAWMEDETYKHVEIAKHVDEVLA